MCLSDLHPQTLLSIELHPEVVSGWRSRPAYASDIQLPRLLETRLRFRRHLGRYPVATLAKIRNERHAKQTTDDVRQICVLGYTHGRKRT